jgi:3-phosphoshikimate 1-carboxyvinyltransferase
MKLQSARRVRGRVRVPGDKSISHRAALLAALTTDGRVRITDYSDSADCASTLACLAQLGVEIERHDTGVEITGAGLQLPGAPRAPLDCGNSGTTMRLLAGLLAGQRFSATLTGDASLRARPMRRIIAPLRQMGAQIESQDERAPLRIEGRRPLQAISYTPPVASAQIKSCVLLAGLNAHGRTEVVERTPTRDHTERLLRWLGVEVQTDTIDDAQHISLVAPTRLAARACAVPGDISAAAFFLCAAALLPGSDLTIERVGLNPTRMAVIDTLRALGVDITITDAHTQTNEPVGSLRARGRARLAPAQTGANTLRGAQVAALIDELPILAVLGTQVAGGLTIRDAKELRVKETDRISALVTLLRALSAEVEEYEDGLSVAAPVPLRGALVDSCGDHRIAMTAAVAALIATGTTEIVGADCVRVSFPDFFPALAAVTER